jgi:glycine/D-amino acid oxidase-like deaminating enzyme
MWRWLKRSLVRTALPLARARLVVIAVGGWTPPFLAGERPLTMSRTEPSLLRLPVFGGGVKRWTHRKMVTLADVDASLGE